MRYQVLPYERERLRRDIGRFVRLIGGAHGPGSRGFGAGRSGALGGWRGGGSGALGGWRGGSRGGCGACRVLLTDVTVALPVRGTVVVAASACFVVTDSYMCTPAMAARPRHKMPPTQMAAFRIVVQPLCLSRSFVVVCMCPRHVVHARGACRGELGLCRGSKS